MDGTIETIPLTNLVLSFIPALVAVYILFRWALDAVNALYSIARMLAQLLLIGYLLTFIFASESAALVVLILAVMVFACSWIALRTVSDKRLMWLKGALIAVGIGGGFTLLLVTQFVLNLSPWYLPQFMIPLAGMIFANSMNSVSLAAERLTVELDRGVSYREARATALNTSLIPVINSMFAVGLVSLPGMMTGQILSGVSPLIAVRYQIMVMCMIFGSAAISTAIFLVLIRNRLDLERTSNKAEN